MQIYTQKQMWNEAASLADNNMGEFDITVFLPYADWLVSQGRYEDSFKAYITAGRIDLGIKILIIVCTL
jgi:hypothetical protein